MVKGRNYPDATDSSKKDQKIMKTPSDSSKKEDKIMMEILESTAKAYFDDLPKAQQDQAQQVFNKIGKDKNGIKQHFKSKKDHVKTKIGLETICSHGFFKMLGKDENETLNFDEFITVHYLCASCRDRFCNLCKEFLGGVYFTCVQCFDRSGDTYDLCCSCYQNKQFEHKHGDGAVFLDNYALLHAKRNQGWASQNEAGASSQAAATKTLQNYVLVDICKLMGLAE